jgi:hypothetical protein
MGCGELQDTLEQKLSAAECQSENVEVQWNIISTLDLYLRRN